MFWKKRPFPEIFFLLIISAVVFLPQVGKLTYYKDDWYYIYDSMVGGTKVFHEMFRIDRPARGYFFEWYFSLLGPNPLPWHIGAFLWRMVAAIGALWIFNILWPKRRWFTFIAAMLFVIYPGYIWWISAIEYQPMIASLALQAISIAFTLKVIQSKNQVEKIAYAIGSILTGWSYIALVDYAIGMEAFRFIAIYLLVNHGRRKNFWSRLFATIKAWAWTTIIPLGIVIWRVFFFTNERKATDIGGQLSVFINNPAGTGVDWFIKIYKSILNIGVLAWINQFPTYLQDMRFRSVALGIVLVGIITALVFYAEKRIKLSVDENDLDENQDRVRKEPLILGGLGMIFGILPVVMANRSVDIGGYSHYGLPASIAAAVFTIGFIDLLSSQRARSLLTYGLIGFAVLSHHGIASNTVTEETALQKFWWQVSWRAPSIRAGTTLIVNYPLYGMGDGGYGLMEAADVIYYPDFTGEIPVHYPIAGLTFSNDIVPNILDGTVYDKTQYRSHTIDFDYSNLLNISQPTLGSCVHIIDGRQPLISAYDPPNMILTATASKIDNVLTDVEFSNPPVLIYGKEPEHDWCYYFQKADLASQLGDWAKVTSLGDETIRLQLSPEDRIEWQPFLKAYALTGNAEQLNQMAKRIIGDKSLRNQVCDMFFDIRESLSNNVQEAIDANYCRGFN